MSKIGLYWFVLSVFIIICFTNHATISTHVIFLLHYLNSCRNFSQIPVPIENRPLLMEDQSIPKRVGEVREIRGLALPFFRCTWMVGWMVDLGWRPSLQRFFTDVIKRSFLRSERLIFLYTGKYKYYPCTLNLYIDLYSRLTHHVFFFCLFSYGHLVTKIFQSYLIY